MSTNGDSSCAAVVQAVGVRGGAVQQRQQPYQAQKQNQGHLTNSHFTNIFLLLAQLHYYTLNKLLTFYINIEKWCLVWTQKFGDRGIITPNPLQRVISIF